MAANLRDLLSCSFFSSTATAMRHVRKIKSRRDDVALFSKLFGGVKKTPEELATLQEAGAALEVLRHERVGVRTALDELIQKRRTALLADESDKHIQALDAEHDRLLLLQERLDAAEPRILARIGDLQGYQRRELLASLVGVFREKESALDAALAIAADALDDYLNTVQQFDAAGFTAQAASIVIRPPFIGVDGVVASKSLLELWRRERERVADRQAALASGRPIDPIRAPRKVVPIPRKIAPPPAPMSIKRAPKRLSGPVPFGYQRVECQMNNVDFQETMCVIGDQFDVMKETADYVLRGSAFTLIAVPENIEDAAQ
jgi:hypothetical protein